MGNNLETDNDQFYEKTNEELKKLVDDVGKGLKTMLKSSENENATVDKKNNSIT